MSIYIYTSIDIEIYIERALKEEDGGERETGEKRETTWEREGHRYTYAYL